MTYWLSISAVLLFTVLLVAMSWRALRRRNLQCWIGSYVTSRRRLNPLENGGKTLDVFLAICDHHEPECDGASRDTARKRVQRWVRQYPERFGRFRDFNGRPPQHTFFFPQDEYRPEYLDELAGLCEQGFGEVDIHLQHGNDNSEELPRQARNVSRHAALPAWPAAARSGNRANRVRNHPQQLRVTKFPTRRPVVRCRPGVDRAAGNGLLRGLHDAVGPQ